MMGFMDYLVIWLIAGVVVLFVLFIVLLINGY